MEKNYINVTMLHDVLGILSKHGFRFIDVSIESCKDLTSANGFSFLSFDLQRGLYYRVYCLKKDGRNNVYSRIAINKESFSLFIKDFREISTNSENDAQNIYLHQVSESISLKDFLINVADDNFKLQSLYNHFVLFYNIIIKYQISIIKPNAEIISLNKEGKIQIDNLDYFMCAVKEKNATEKNDFNLNFNSIWLLTFLRIVTDNPDLLFDDKIFLELENGLSEDFLQKYVLPSLTNKEYRLLLSIISCLQHGYMAEIKIDLPGTCNTQITQVDLKCQKKLGDWRYSFDGLRLLGICDIYEIQSRGFYVEIAESTQINIKGCQIVCDRALEGINESSYIQFSEGITTLGRDVFHGVNRIKRLDLPESLKACCGNPFENVIIEEVINLSPHFVATSNALYSKGLHRLISFYGETKEFKVPNKTVTIGEDAFSYNDYIEYVFLDESVVEIDDRAFCCCANIKKIVLPNSLKRIGRQAFKQLSKSTLNELIIPCSVEYIGRDAFHGINSIVCDDSPYFKVEEYALLSKNGKDFLYYFGSAKTYKIPYGVKTVWASAFRENESIEEIIVPHSVKIIEDNAFENCKKLRTVKIESDFLSLGKHAFWGCEMLCSITMPLIMGNLKFGTFFHCNLSEIDIPEGVEIIGEESFFHCSSLKKIKLPQTIKSIENNAFGFCNNLQDVVLPEGLKKIGYQAFESCRALSKIVFPESLEVVQKRAFAYCSLKECYILNEESSIASDAFNSGNYEMVLFLPSKTKQHPYMGPKSESIMPFIDNKPIDDLLD